ncbi:cation:proton antiporter regulatory subunit [Marinithermus hydrothermalis]|uniref:TrkA-C domain protein n=1 Tax=Marinithermus hydrothermalis (strain DSM 14884 / JCM 11576 / T1) TaxID=869210 RepID=F2NLU1_MARHT|nr:TrkA C-terminal domain-containing protein [Marinithermus hydrothermalis]AEB10921.1 TrkA-C domain protein [Marinithermus hydrothermalis DSM 14884]
MRIEESVLPGVGRKYTIHTRSNDRLVVVVHHSGRREVYFYPDAQEDPTATLELSDEEAREVGAILSGVLFHPEAVGEVKTHLARQTIEWIEIPAGAPCVGRPLSACQPQVSGAHVLAVLREGEALLPNPPPDTRLEPGDTLVVAGPREAVDAFKRSLQ